MAIITNTTLNFKELEDKIRLELEAEKFGIRIKFEGSLLKVWHDNLNKVTNLGWRMSSDLRSIIRLATI